MSCAFVPVGSLIYVRAQHVLQDAADERARLGEVVDRDIATFNKLVEDQHIRCGGMVAATSTRVKFASANGKPLSLIATCRPDGGGRRAPSRGRAVVRSIELLTRAIGLREGRARGKRASANALAANSHVAPQLKIHHRRHRPQIGLHVG